MKPFQFIQPRTLNEAVQSSRDSSSMWLGGGTTLIDLMKLNVLTPTTVVSIKPLLDSNIEQRGEQIYIGAGCTMAMVADDPLVKERLPVVRQSLLLAASPQIRNMATMAGNLLQRSRSPYFRHTDFPAGSRDVVAGKLENARAEGIDTSSMAVLGHNGRMMGTYPGDFGVAFVGLEGIVHTRGPEGERAVEAREFFSSPPDSPTYQTALKPGELIVGLSIPTSPAATRSLYLKIRERSSYAFALASAAVALQLEGQGAQAKIVDARVSVGGLATIPWPCPAAEKKLKGNLATDTLFREAADIALADAQPPQGLETKVTLAKRVLVRAWQQLRDQGVPSDRDIWAFQHGRLA